MGGFEKREFSSDKREELAGKGQALPDGSYPIVTVGDLHNAISAFGRAKNQAQVKRHIISRARALDALDVLPEDWNVTKEKADGVAEVLGIVDAPAHIGEEHAKALDEMHDALETSKKEMQGKNNYATSTYLAMAQRHLKDAKSFVETKALNADTKHTLAKACLGKACQAITSATHKANGNDKAGLYAHNKAISDFASNPSATFVKDNEGIFVPEGDEKIQKSNENHDEHGRFASGDGSSSGSSDKPSALTTSTGAKSIRSNMTNINESYKNAVVAARQAGASPADGDLLDLGQIHEDVMNHMGDAIDQLKLGNVSEARSSLSYAADLLSEHSAFKENVGVTRALAQGIGGNMKKSLDEEVISKALEFAKAKESENISDALGFAKYAMNPELPIPSAQQEADVAVAESMLSEMIRETATALAIETDEDKAKEMGEIIADLNNKKMYVKQGNYTYAKHTSGTIGQAMMAGLGEGYIARLTELRTKLHALDHTYINHTGF